MTTYEWDIETTDGDDNVEHHHCDTIPARPMRDGERLVLVRDDDNGRSWAYVENGALDSFRDSAGEFVCDVPVRYRREFAKSIHAMQTA